VAVSWGLNSLKEDRKEKHCPICNISKGISHGRIACEWKRKMTTFPMTAVCTDQQKAWISAGIFCEVELAALKAFCYKKQGLTF
jgi:hypothetical protein